MNFLEGLGLPANIAIFAIGAVFVWLAGYRIAQYADEIARRTGLGQALIGLLLLGGVTSLPELAVTLTAAVSGSTQLAVNNVLGGVAMQVAILAVADFFIRRRALTSVVADPVVLLQGSLDIILLALVACATVVGDVAVLGIGLWSWAILAMFIVSLWLLANANDRQPWLANTGDRGDLGDQQEKQDESSDADEHSSTSLYLKTSMAGAVILVAGFAVAKSGEAIAQQTGLGESFFGAVFVAITTSLPEVSTVLSAVRMGLLTMAISDILGTNLFDVALLFLVDAFAGGDPALASAGRFGTLAALIGILVTALFVAGLAERRDRTILGIGYDSAAVIVTYLIGIGLLYNLRGG